MTHLLCSPNAVSDATVLGSSVKCLTIKAVVHGIEIMVGPGPATQFESPGAAKFSRNKHTNRISEMRIDLHEEQQVPSSRFLPVHVNWCVCALHV